MRIDAVQPARRIRPFERDCVDEEFAPARAVTSRTRSAKLTNSSVKVAQLKSLTVRSERPGRERRSRPGAREGRSEPSHRRPTRCARTTDTCLSQGRETRWRRRRVDRARSARRASRPPHAHVPWAKTGSNEPPVCRIGGHSASASKRYGCGGGPDSTRRQRALSRRALRRRSGRLRVAPGVPRAVDRGRRRTRGRRRGLAPGRAAAGSYARLKAWSVPTKRSPRSIFAVGEHRRLEEGPPSFAIAQHPMLENGVHAEASDDERAEQLRDARGRSSDAQRVRARSTKSATDDRDEHVLERQNVGEQARPAARVASVEIEREIDDEDGRHGERERCGRGARVDAAALAASRARKRARKGAASTSSAIGSRLRDVDEVQAQAPHRVVATACASRPFGSTAAT